MKHKEVKNNHGLENVVNSLQRKIILKGVSLTKTLGSKKLLGYVVGNAGLKVEGFGRKGGALLWMLGKEGLKEDFLETFNDLDWGYPVDFPRGIPKQLARTILPPEIDDNNYAIQSDLIENLKLDYRLLWQEIFRSLPEHKRPKAIATGNFGYYAERELAHAAELEGIPFIAMHKECLKSKGRIEFFNKVYGRRGSFKGRKILVYNERERQLQINSGVASSEQVVKCGMPRLDRLHRWRVSGDRSTFDSPVLLALGFNPNTGLPRIPRKGLNGGQARYEYLNENHREMRWDNFFLHYHEVLVKLARDNPSWIVKLKLKARHRDADPSIRLIRELGAPDNLQIHVGGDPVEHLIRSDVICGFNTTAVLEGLAAGLPVVTPEFDEVLEPDMRDFAVSFGDSTFSPNDPQSMYQVLKDLMVNRTPRHISLSTSVEETLDTWLGNPDGLSAKRVMDVFIKEMAKS